MELNFKIFLESLSLVDEIQPNEKYKNIYVRDEKNPQQVARWKKITTKKIYSMPLAEESFIHFTLCSTSNTILKEQKLTTDCFAVSTTYGIWLPVVQYNHIINKKKEKLIPPLYLKKPKEKKAYLSRGWKIPNFSEEICAILFKTNSIPKAARIEEVYWDHPLEIHSTSLLSSREAILRLKNCKYKINDQDEVRYH